MKIRDLLAAESIELNGKVTGKKEALDAMVDLMAKSGKINDVEVYRKGVYARDRKCPHTTDFFCCTGFFGNRVCIHIIP